ncbi:hypothetical protein J2853_005841 [Streptosporangium lutulentum]|uniref:DUF11 domain-containing protein n=1 Tax=Streptosporangium lutulentum TaxID=1461250 RepID=A0ABT9QIP8_9ACTN|nr:hypothetical protein [Streptosporangium lutulentum]
MRIVAGVVSLVLAVAPGAASARSGEKNLVGADLSVRLSVLPKLAQPGKPLIYRADVSNAGPEDAVLPVLVVRLPEGVEVIGVNVAECLPGGAANEVICASRQDVMAGDAGGVTISGLVRPGARGPLRATATLSSEIVDENGTNDSAQTSTPVGEGTDLAVRLSRRAIGGRLVTVGAVVRNRGPRAVRDAAVFFDTGKARFLSASGARCRPRPGSVGCALRTVGSGGKVSMRLTFRAHGRGPRAQATVYSVRLGDRRPANNIASLTPSSRPKEGSPTPETGDGRSTDHPRAGAPRPVATGPAARPAGRRDPPAEAGGSRPGSSIGAHGRPASVLSRGQRGRTSQASATMSRTDGCSGFHPSSRWIFSDEATSTAGSPARRSCTTAGISCPVTSRQTDRTS